MATYAEDGWFSAAGQRTRPMRGDEDWATVERLAKIAQEQEPARVPESDEQKEERRVQ